MTAEGSERQLSFIMTAFLAYLSSPFLFALMLYFGLEFGPSVPSYADSIGIPLAGFILLWSFGVLAVTISGIVLVISRFAEIQRRP